MTTTSRSCSRCSGVERLRCKSRHTGRHLSRGSSLAQCYESESNLQPMSHNAARSLMPWSRRNLLQWHPADPAPRHSQLQLLSSIRAQCHESTRLHVLACRTPFHQIHTCSGAFPDVTARRAQKRHVTRGGILILALAALLHPCQVIANLILEVIRMTVLIILPEIAGTSLNTEGDIGKRILLN